MPAASLTEVSALGNASGSPRFGEISKLLPVGVVLAMIVTLYTEYVFLHCLRLLQLDLPPEQRKQAEAEKGFRQLCIFHVITILMLYCFGRCILQHPGTIPENAGWDLGAGDEDLEVSSATKGLTGLKEKKHTGERRHCKWCPQDGSPLSLGVQLHWLSKPQVLLSVAGICGRRSHLHQRDNV